MGSVVRTGLDHGAGVVAAGGVDGLPVDVQKGVGEHGRRAVDHLARAVEGAGGEGAEGCVVMGGYGGGVWPASLAAYQKCVRASVM